MHPSPVPFFQDKEALYVADVRRLHKLATAGLVFDPAETEDPEADGWTPVTDQFGDAVYPTKGPRGSPPWVGKDNESWFDIDHDDGKGVTERVREEDLKTGKRLNKAGTK